MELKPVGPTEEILFPLAPIERSGLVEEIDP